DVRPRHGRQLLDAPPARRQGTTRRSTGDRVTESSRTTLTYPEPFRVRLPDPSKARLAWRGSQVTFAFAGALSSVGARAAVGKSSASSTAASFKHAFDQLGGTFVKLGQIVASAPGMF